VAYLPFHGLVVHFVLPSGHGVDDEHEQIGAGNDEIGHDEIGKANVRQRYVASVDAP